MNYLTLAQSYLQQRCASFVVVKHLEWTSETHGIPVRGFAEVCKFYLLWLNSDLEHVFDYHQIILKGAYAWRGVCLCLLCWSESAWVL